MFCCAFGFLFVFLEGGYCFVGFLGGVEGEEDQERGEDGGGVEG